MKELEALEARTSPISSPPNRPPRRVGEKPVEGFIPVVHDRPMLSIDNCYDEQGLRDFEDRVRKLLPGRADRLRGRAQDRRAGHLHPLPGRQIRPGRDARRRGPRRRRHRQRQDHPVPAPGPSPSRGTIEVRGEIYLPVGNLPRRSTGSGRRRRSRSSPTRETPRPGPSASSTPRRWRRGTWTSSSTPSSSTGASRPRSGRACRTLKALGFRTNPHSRRCRDDRRSHRLLQGMDREEGLPRLTKPTASSSRSTRRRSGETLGTTAKSPRWAIVLQVPRPAGDDPCQRHHHPGRPDRGPDAGRDPRARQALRDDDQPVDAPQRGRDPAQGHPRSAIRHPPRTKRRRHPPRRLGDEGAPEAGKRTTFVWPKECPSAVRTSSGRKARSSPAASIRPARPGSANPSFTSPPAGP